MQIFEKNGHRYIAAKIDEAIRNGTRTATVSGDWEISEAVRIPSDFTLILDDCHLRMADGCYSNMFVNANHDTALGKTRAGTDKSISILGRGRAILDGGEYNGLSEKNHSQNGLPPIWKNNLILFTNVDGFRVSDISCRNQRWWAINLVYCANGYVGGIDFCANDTAIDQNGNVYHGLRRDAYAEILVKTADGVDLRQGCHDIVIENLTGFVEDDSVALTALDWHLERHFAVEGLSPDICHITVRNIRTAAFCSNVRLLSQGGLKLHDIEIDGVYDMGPTSPYMDRGRCAVRVGDTYLYGARHATKEETYNITIRNVVGGGLHVLSLAGEIGNLTVEGIEAVNGAELLLDARTR